MKLVTFALLPAVALAGGAVELTKETFASALAGKNAFVRLIWYHTWDGWCRCLFSHSFIPMSVSLSLITPGEVLGALVRLIILKSYGVVAFFYSFHSV